MGWVRVGLRIILKYGSFAARCSFVGIITFAGSRGIFLMGLGLASVMGCLSLFIYRNALYDRLLIL